MPQTGTVTATELRRRSTPTTSTNNNVVSVTLLEKDIVCTFTNTESVTPTPNLSITEPKPGDRWYDADAHCLCIWDGIEWDPVPLDWR